MIKMKIVFFCIFIFTLLACSGDVKKNLQPEIASCDSAAVMYYHTPGNPRFFNFTKVYDKEAINIVSKAINRKIIKPRDTCTTQGKIYFYGNRGAVYVVYFSRLHDCMTLSFIKTGEKYFIKMTKDVHQLLDVWQKEAKAIGND